MTDDKTDAALTAARAAVETTTTQEILSGWPADTGGLRAPIRKALQSTDSAVQKKGRQDFFTTIIMPEIETALRTGKLDYPKSLAATPDAELVFIRKIQKKGSVAALETLGIPLPQPISQVTPNPAGATTTQPAKRGLAGIFAAKGKDDGGKGRQ